jgi:hypothetical protein
LPSKLMYQVSEKTKGNAPGKKIAEFEPETKTLKKNRDDIMTIYSPPSVRGGDILEETLCGLNVSVTDIVAVSWNVQMMQRIDGPNNDNVTQAIADKAKNAAKVAENPGISGANPRHGASLLVIQEAPGPQLRTKGAAGEVSKAASKGAAGEVSKAAPKGAAGEVSKVADGFLFTKELREQPYFRNFKFQEVELSNVQEEFDPKTGGKKERERGEDHIFGWDSTRLDPLKFPTPLQAPNDGEKWVARAPSWAEFKVKNSGTALIVVSVHAKSGGKKETQDDISMIGEAVNKLWCSEKEQLSKREPPIEDLIVLVAGDFNYPSSQVFKGPKKLFDSDYCLAEPFKSDIKTNMWMFNGSGDEQADGESYDYGIVRSIVQGNTSKVKATMNVPPVVIKELEAVQHEMEQLGKQIKKGFIACLQTDDDSEDECQPKSTSIRRKVEKSMMKKFTDDGNVPTWMREEFKHFVRLTWSDHMPIAIRLSIPGAPQQSPPSTSQGPPQYPPPDPPLRQKLFNELEGAKGGE